MIAKPPHSRKLGVIEVSLTKQRLKPQWRAALDCVRDELESIIVNTGYLAEAPFSWVTVAVRYGLKNDEKPSYQKINKKYGDLPLAIEINTHELIEASPHELKVIYKRAVLKALIHAGKKFGRPTGELETILEGTSGQIH